MEYRIENSELCLTVNSAGAELWGLHRRGEEGRPLLWDGKADVWPRRAPVCFPWCGKAEDGRFTLRGRPCQVPQHGFIRDREHTLTGRGEEHLDFCLEWPGEDTLWPWAFTFTTRHSLEGNTVVTTCTAVNRSEEPMPAQLGFHTGLRCPFTPGLTPQDYCLRFERPEAPGGTDCFPLEEHVFDNDSICFPDLTSRWIQLEERGSGRSLRVSTGAFPFVLLWSKPGIPGFVCIEPWTGYSGPGQDPAQRPGACLLEPGESFSRTQRLTVSL